jgi:hypothetical protein
VKWRASKDSFVCGNRKIPMDRLARYRSFVSKSGPTKGLYMVALRDVQPGPATVSTTTTSAGVSTTAPATSAGT